MQALQGVDLELVNIMSKKNSLVAVATTDSVGHFRFEYKHVHGWSEPSLFIETAQCCEDILAIPANQDLNLGAVYRNPTGTLDVFLTADNPHSSDDTMTIASGDGELEGLPAYFGGPFTDGHLLTLTLHKNDLSHSTLYGQPAKGYLRWWLNGDSANYSETEFYLHGCGVVDSISLDLN
jgi:hypothetical protein